MANSLDELLTVQQTALRLREQRQGILASNIANADTPNYKARDIDFSAVLKQTLGSSKPALDSAMPMTVSSAAHLTGKKSSGSGAVLQYRNDQQGRIDGNNVDMDYERMQFAENAMHYEAAITLVSGKIRSMLSVIQA